MVFGMSVFWMSFEDLGGLTKRHRSSSYSWPKRQQSDMVNAISRKLALGIWCVNAQFAFVFVRVTEILFPITRSAWRAPLLFMPCRKRNYHTISCRSGFARLHL